MLFIGLTITSLKEFGAGLWVAFPLLLTLATAVPLLGQAMEKKKGRSHFDSFHLSFVTATIVGYGHIRTAHRGSRALAISIAFIRLILTGIITAIAVHAGEKALSAIGT